jgi:hypothetical protein
MTKRDYIVFAQMVKTLPSADRTEYDDCVSRDDLIGMMGDIFEADNPLFNPDRFRKACRGV